MCSAISLSWRELPDNLIELHQLHKLKRTRPPAGDVEYHFQFCNKPACIPVWIAGQLQIQNWEGFCPREQLEAGNWAERHPQPVTVPATFICDGGVWYPVKGSICAVLVRKRIYIVTQPADHYHKIMCGTSWMVVEGDIGV